MPTGGACVLLHIFFSRSCRKKSRHVLLDEMQPWRLQQEGRDTVTVDGTISIRVDGEHRRGREELRLAERASGLGCVPEKVAVERNLEVVPRSTLADIRVEDGDELEIVHFVGGGDISADDGWEVAGQRFSSRLIVGTGKYKSFEIEEHTSELQSLMSISYAVFCLQKKK